MVVAVMLVGVVAVATTASADCSITTTLRVGSRGAEVKCLQTGLNLKADGVFGKNTKAALMQWQASKNLVADGILGAKGRAAWGNTTPSTPPTTPPVVTSGPISVMVSSDTPATGYIIDNQATADLLHLTFTGTGTVNSVTLHRTGISDQNTLSNVYLYDGVNRLTDGYSFNTASDIVINNLGLAVNGSRTIQVKADASSTASNNSTITVALTSFTPAGGSATATNLLGNVMWLASGSSLATVKFSAANTVTGSPTVDTGTQAYTVWSQAVQVNTRTVMLKGANFRMSGSAPIDAFANIKLYVDGVDTGKTANVVALNGSNYAVFDLMSSPLSLITGSHTLDLRVDVVRGASYNVTTSMQNAADLMVFDPQVGVNIAVTTSGAGAIPSSGASVTINAGTGTMVNDPAFNALSNVTGGASNIVIAKYKIVGYSEDIKVQTLSVTPVLASMTPAAAGLQNVALFFNGSQVGSQTSSWSSGAISFSLGSQLIVPAGSVSYLEVRADLRTTGGVNYSAGTVSADVTSVASNAQGQVSKSNVTLPTASITGHTLSVQTGLLAVSKNTGYASQSVTPNTSGVKIGSYVLQNQSTSESVRVTSLLVAFKDNAGAAMTSSSTPALTNFSGLKTSETSGSGATPRQPTASNTISVDFTVIPGATKTIDIFADTSTTVSTSMSTTLVVTSIGSLSNVSVDQNGNGTAVAGQTITLATGTLTNPPTILTANSTAQQFVPAGNGGATDATKATFKINATGGAATISELKLTVNSQDFSSAGSWASLATGSRVFTPTVAADADRFVVGDSVQVCGGTTCGLGTVTAVTATTSITVAVTVAGTGSTTGTAKLVPGTVTSVRVGSVTAPVVSGVAYLTGLNLSVPNGGSGLTQDVYVSYSPVGTNGVSTGSTSRLALEYIKYSGGGSTSTLCTAALTTCDVVLAAGGVAAPIMKLVGSRPTMTLASSNSTLVLGSTDVGSVTVTANAKGDITLNALPITVTQSTGTTQPNANPGYAANGIRVYDKDNNLVTTTNTQFSGTTAGGTSTITFTNGYVISAGTSQTFHVYLTFDAFTNPGGAHTSSVSLGLGTADLFSWTDTAGNASATTGLDSAGSAVTTVSNRYLYSSTAPGFFYGYPTNTVSVSS